MRFFRRRDQPTPASHANAASIPTSIPDADVIDAELGEQGELGEHGEYDDVPPEHVEHEDVAWRERAAAVIPGGASTGSKRPDALYGPAAAGPTHFVRAAGCEIETAGGERLIDCTMALGAVAIGYADRHVTERVVEAVAMGNVAGLSHTLEVDVAERLCEVIPCAERVRFLKSGAEAVAAAVRLARAATGRQTVVGSGYFGWLDWWTEGPGIPDGAHADFVPVPFDDVAAPERTATTAGAGLAAIVLEPVVERLPSDAWIAAARALCDRLGAVLVFDEIKTGFRLRTGGYQELAGVTPDLATFGKAMANGFPLAAVVGRAEIMDAAHRSWISSTLAGESTALAAAGAVLDWHADTDVCAQLWANGREMREAVAAAARQSGVPGVTVGGIDPMWLLRFDDAAMQTRFGELARAEGVLFKRGAYNFASLAHDERVRTAVERAASTAFVELLEERA